VKFLHELVFGKNSIVSGIAALAVVASIALGCNCGKNFADLANAAANNATTNTNARTDETDNETVPPESAVETLVKDTTADFADAIDSGDFSDLYANASSDFRSTYTEDEIRTAFKSYTDKKRIVLPVLKKVPAADADFSQPPSIRTEKGLKILMAKGKFPTKPYTVRYDYEYIMREGDWKLLKLVINIP
jgi:hypothetical protein